MKTTLGTLISEYSVRNKLNKNIPVYSVTNERGFCTGYFSKEVASSDKTTYKIVPRGFFAYNPSRINVGSVDWLRCEEQVIVSPLYVVFSVNENLDQQYLLHYLKSDVMLTLIKAYATGSVRDNLKFSILKELPINLRPIEEQREIANILDYISALIEKHQQQLSALEKLVKSRFIEMFGDIHESTLYPYVTIESFTSVMSGGTPDRGVPEYWQEGTIRWVKTTELQNCIITDTEEKITKLGMDNSSAKLIPADSILIAMYGQGRTRGMTGYITVECTTNQACACILPSKIVNQKFLWSYMILSYEKLREMAKGGNQPNLSAGIIKKFPILMPPMELQQNFASFVEQVDKSKLAIKKCLEQLETLKKSLMQEYFG